MWEHYRKTFMGMQIVIALVTIGVYLLLGQLAQAAVFFLVMQISAVMGAVWAARIKAMRSPGGRLLK